LEKIIQSSNERWRTLLRKAGQLRARNPFRKAPRTPLPTVVDDYIAEKKPFTPN